MDNAAPADSKNELSGFLLYGLDTQVPLALTSLWAKPANSNVHIKLPLNHHEQALQQSLSTILMMLGWMLSCRRRIEDPSECQIEESAYRQSSLVPKREDHKDLTVMFFIIS